MTQITSLKWQRHEYAAYHVEWHLSGFDGDFNEYGDPKTEIVQYGSARSTPYEVFVYAEAGDEYPVFEKECRSLRAAKAEVLNFLNLNAPHA